MPFIPCFLCFPVRLLRITYMCGLRFLHTSQTCRLAISESYEFTLQPSIFLFQADHLFMSFLLWALLALSVLLYLLVLILRSSQIILQLLYFSLITITLIIILEVPPFMILKRIYLSLQLISHLRRVLKLVHRVDQFLST